MMESTIYLVEGEHQAGPSETEGDDAFGSSVDGVETLAKRVVVGSDGSSCDSATTTDARVLRDWCPDNDHHTAVEAEYSPIDHMDSMVESGIEMEASDDEELGDTSRLNSDERNKLYARGLSREKEGRRDAALKCYMGCLSGLTQTTRFVLLPHCLRNIAEIYCQNQEYDKAIQFIQAEKVYYENALINTEEVQQKLEELTTGLEGHLRDREGDFRSLETHRAEEYEHLAKLSLDKMQTQQALEYAGKCTKLRQQLFGEFHPKTLESLEFFAQIYAQVSKQQNNDSFESGKVAHVTMSPPVFTDSESSAPITPIGDGTPVSILRNRKHSDKERKQVRFHESVVDKNSHHQRQEERLSHILLGVLVLACCLCFLGLALGVYCRLTESGFCRSLVQAASNAYTNLAFHYYKLTSLKPA